jgi:hypothetical protein
MLSSFIREWLQAVDINPVTNWKEIAQSVEFIYTNGLFRAGLVKSRSNYQEHILPNEIAEFIQGLKQEIIRRKETVSKGKGTF